MFGRQRNAACATVRIDGAAANDCVNSVTVLQSPFQCFQDKYDAAFGANIAIRVRGEGAAQPGRREHRRLGESNELVGARQDIHAANEGRVDFAACKRVTRFMKSDERRGTGGV